MRVAVTTTRPQPAERIGGLLERSGLMPVYLPCIRVEPAASHVLDRFRWEAENADWIVVTSRRAVEIVWPESDMPSGPAVAAVGSSTAEAVRAAGGRVEVLGRAGVAALRHDLEGRIDGSTVVFPHARAADPETGRWIGQRAARIIARPAYDTIPIPPGDDPVDVVIFGSPSAVRGWLQARTLGGVEVAAMGETTAAFLESRGRGADIVPDRPGFERLVEMVAGRAGTDERSDR